MYVYMYRSAYRSNYRFAEERLSANLMDMVDSQKGSQISMSCLIVHQQPATTTAAAVWRHHLLQDRRPTHALQEPHRGGADVDSALC